MNMKRLYIFVVVLFLACFFGKKTDVFAMEMQELETEKMSENEKAVFLGNIDIDFFYTEPVKDSIRCFDVNSRGDIAIGTQKETDKTICIYSPDGNFKYGYSFKTDGSFGLELTANLLKIYYVRSGAAVSIDFDGNIQDVARISNTLENDSYWHDVVRATRKNEGDYQYVLKNDIGLLGILTPTYSQLHVIDNTGNEVIVYDVNSAQYLNVLLTFLGTILFVILDGISITEELIKMSHQEKKIHQNED